MMNMKMKKGMAYSKGGMPDLTGDGKVTRADVLKGRGVFKRGGSVKKYASGGSATFTARDKQTPDYSTFGAMSVTEDGEPTHTYKLDKDGKPYRSGSSRSTSDSPRVTRITALNKDGKPPRNALSGLTDKEIDKLFESGDFRVGPGGVPKRPTEAQLRDAVRERGGSVKKYAKGGSVSSASKRADGCATKGKTRGKFV
jgi:hypothetical protein